MTKLVPLVVQLGIVTLMTFAAAMVFSNSFRRVDLLGPLLVASLTPCIITIAATAARRPPVTAVAASGAALVALLVGWTSGEEGWPIRPISEIVLDGPARILTSSIPAPSTAALLGVPFTLAWLACTTSAWAVVRTRSSLLPSLPPAIVLVIGGLFASDGLGWAPETAWVLVLFGLLLAALRSWWDERSTAAAGIAAIAADHDEHHDQATSTPGRGGTDRAARRRAALVGSMLVALTLLAGLVVPNLPGLADRDSVDLRSRFALEPDAPLATSPLDALASGYVDDPRTDEDERDRLVLTITGEDGIPVTTTSRGDRVVQVTKSTLDTYDGARWIDPSTYQAAGTPLPPDPDLVASTPTSTHVLDFELHTVDGIWLPTVGRARELSPREGIGDAAVDPLSGTLITRGGRPDDGARYRIETVTTDLGDPDDRRIAPALPPSGPATAIGTGDTDLSAQIARLDEIARAATPGLAFTEQVRALEGLFHNEVLPEAEPALDTIRFDDIDFRFVGPDTVDASQSADDDSDEAIGKAVPTGHSLERILRFLYTPNEQDELARRRGLGTPEQFATAFVLLARTQGIPARVAVGYTVPVEEDSPTTVEVRARHADAWPEVYTANLGWVPIAPTPPDLGEQVSRSDADATTTTTSATTPASDDVAAPPTVVLDDGTAGTGESSSSRFLLAIVVIVIVVLLAVLLVPTFATQRRRSARKSLSPAGSIAGAWDDTVEHLMRCGAPLDPSMTAAQAESATRQALGDATGSSTGRLAALVERAVCAPEEPTAEDARRAWATAEEVRRNASRQLGGTARIRAALDPSAARRRRLRVESATRDLRRPLGPKDLVDSGTEQDVPLGIDLRLPSGAGTLGHLEGDPDTPADAPAGGAVPVDAAGRG